MHVPPGERLLVDDFVEPVRLDPPRARRWRRPSSSSSCGFARQNPCMTLRRAAPKAARDSGFRAGSAVHRSSGSWRTTWSGPSSIQWGRVRVTGSTGPTPLGDCWACDGSADGRESAAYCRSRVASSVGSAFRMPAARPRSWVVRTATAQSTCSGEGVGAPSARARSAPATRMVVGRGTRSTPSRCRAGRSVPRAA